MTEAEFVKIAGREPTELERRVNGIPDIRDEIASEMYRRRANSLASSVLEHNALYKRIVERRAEWAALPWHVKLRRKAKARLRMCIWRIGAAWRVLKTGDIE